MHRHVESRHGFVRQDSAHQTSTPPPNEKNVRKKLEAAKAIDRPKMIWMSRRKPPDVSPKASVRPVVMMMITAMIFATGPSTDCRTCCSGCSQGMFEPAARAESVTSKGKETDSSVVTMIWVQSRSERK